MFVKKKFEMGGASGERKSFPYLGKLRWGCRSLDIAVFLTYFFLVE